MTQATKPSMPAAIATAIAVVAGANAVVYGLGEFENSLEPFRGGLPECQTPLEKNCVIPPGPLIWPGMGGRT